MPPHLSADRPSGVTHGTTTSAVPRASIFSVRFSGMRRSHDATAHMTIPHITGKIGTSGYRRGWSPSKRTGVAGARSNEINRAKVWHPKLTSRSRSGFLFGPADVLESKAQLAGKNRSDGRRQRIKYVRSARDQKRIARLEAELKRFMEDKENEENERVSMLETEKHDMESELQTLRDEKKTDFEELEALKAQNAELRYEVQQVKEAMEKLPSKTDLQDAEELIVKLRSDKEDLESRLESLEEDLNRQRDDDGKEIDELRKSVSNLRCQVRTSAMSWMNPTKKKKGKSKKK